MKRVGIIRGGEREQYGASLKRGGEIISHINDNLSDKWKVVDILIDKDGSWHLNGVSIKPADLMHQVDIVWNTTHPSASLVLDSLSIPNVGQSSFHSAMENSRDMLREHMKQIGVGVPRHLVLPLYQEDFDGPRERYAIKKAKEVFEKFSAPWIVKSFTPDSSMGIHLAKTFDELVGAIEDGINHEKSILVEEFIAGKVVSVHSLHDFRGKDVYAFPFSDAFDNFTFAEKEKLFTLAKSLHNHIGTKHYLKSDFVLNPKGKVYLLGAEPSPDLKPGSNFSEVCELAGAKTHHIIEHILNKTL